MRRLLPPPQQQRAVSTTTLFSSNNNNHNNNASHSHTKQRPPNNNQYYNLRRSQSYFHTTAPSAFANKPRSWGLDSNSLDYPDNDGGVPGFSEEDFATLSSLRDHETNDKQDDDEERERYRIQQEKVNHELDSRKGRPWRDPWEIKEEQWTSSDTSSENLPDWSPAFVSRISLERLQVLPIEDGGGIPTLQSIAELSLPGSDPALHPSRKTKTYAAYRKSRHFSDVADCVERLAKVRVEVLLKEASGGDDPSDQQDAIDALFEALQEEAKADGAMDILVKHPSFPSWVDRGLELYLRTAQNEALLTSEQTSETTEEEGQNEASSKDETTATAAGGSEKNEAEPEIEPKPWKEATPVFMDCYDPAEASPDGSSTGPMVPKILTPLGPHRHGGPGRMVEEWELSAHSTTKRIMLRECTQEIAGILSADEPSESPSSSTQAAAAAAAPKIYVHGRKGVGKSAVLASIVASARKSGSIVMYLPDGDRLRKNGFFITPNTHPDRQGMFDLQDLSQEALKQLVESHDAAEQMKGMVADRETLEQYFHEAQFKRLDDYRAGLENAATDDDGSISLLHLISYSQEHKKHAPMCYSVVVNRLMHQTDKTFMIVMDEFNCLFDKGHYFHMAYDEEVREAIPYDQINLFEPIMVAMDISTKTVEDEEDESDADTEGGDTNTTNTTNFDTTHTAVLVGTSESHAIRSEIITKLTDCAERNDAVTTIEVPRFSSVEADHILANFEATGIGKLRLDRGDTLMNPQEMEYLKMSSGSIGQKLLDVSIF